MKRFVLLLALAIAGCGTFAQKPAPQMVPPAGREAHMGEDYAACQIVADQSRQGNLMLDSMQRGSTVRNCLISKGYTVATN